MGDLFDRMNRIFRMGKAEMFMRRPGREEGFAPGRCIAVAGRGG
jgi:hypothetical protein